MGWSGLVGFTILVGVVPLNYYLGKISVQIARKRSIARDDRQASLQELLSCECTRQYLCFWLMLKFFSQLRLPFCLEKPFAPSKFLAGLHPGSRE